MFLLLLIIPLEPQIATVERIEINYCYRENGDRRFIQVVYWNPDGHVREWHMLGCCKLIRRVRGREEYPYTLIRRCNDKTQVIRCRRIVITETEYDPEERDRRLLPVERRVKLFER